MDPLLYNEINSIHIAQADGGVGCGPGVRPTINADCAVLEKYVALARIARPTNPWHYT